MCGIPVLIETYWNVKMKSKGKDRQVFRINRNILECKVILSNNRFGAARVLIETYWNVKVVSPGVIAPGE